MDIDLSSITGLSADSRTVKNGYIFAALPGVKADGRDFMDHAVKNGATHILAPTGTAFPTDVIGIESDHPRRDFALLCAQYYKGQPDNIVAVTGTNGKTSVADFVRQIFEMADYKSASIGTLGLISNTVEGESVMTTPDPVLLHQTMSKLHRASVTHVAMEASSHGLDQYRLDGLNLKVAAFTNLSQDHLDYHGDMEGYFMAKKRLFTELLLAGGVAVVNADDEYGLRLLSSLRGGEDDEAIQNGNCGSGLLPPGQTGGRNDVTSYGTNENATLRLLSQTPTMTGQHLEVSCQGETHSLDLPLIGTFQAYNVLCAAACCIGLGMDADFVFNCLPNLKTVSGRLEIAARIGNKAAYIDYAHTPDALEKVLTALRPHVDGRLICVFGAGGDRDATKRPLMGRAVAENADIAIITDDNPRSEDPATIRAAVAAACPNALNIGDRAAAIAEAVKILQDVDVLLVAGKGHEVGQEIKGEIIPFNDLEVTKRMMKEHAA